MDDEPCVLTGIRVALRADRHRWDLVFASTGATALEIVGREPRVDVVVSDLNMPAMSGVQLLERCRQQHPAIRRIMLTGNVESPLLTGVRPTIDELLPKPCEASKLRAAIELALLARHAEPRRPSAQNLAAG